MWQFMSSVLQNLPSWLASAVTLCLHTLVAAAVPAHVVLRLGASLFCSWTCPAVVLLDCGLSQQAESDAGCFEVQQ
jgi:polyferredoxin